MGNINQGRYDRLLRRTTAQVGPGSKVGNALEDLFPVLEVENAPIELLRASGWVVGMGQIFATSAVGTTPAHQLFNPPNSSKLVVLTHLSFVATAAVVIRYGPAFVALTDASIPGAQRDTRDGQIRSTVALLQREDDGVASTFAMRRLAASVQQEIFDQNGLAVLAPGSGFVLTSATTNVNLGTSWLWRERVAEPEELDF